MKSLTENSQGFNKWSCATTDTGHAQKSYLTVA